MPGPFPCQVESVFLQVSTSTKHRDASALLQFSYDARGIGDHREPVALKQQAGQLENRRAALQENGISGRNQVFSPARNGFFFLTVGAHQRLVCWLKVCTGHDSEEHT